MDNEEKAKRLVTVQKAALILGISPKTLREWDRKDKFKAKRHPINGYRMYDLSDVEALKNKIEK